MLGKGVENNNEIYTSQVLIRDLKNHEAIVLEKKTINFKISNQNNIATKIAESRLAVLENRKAELNRESIKVETLIQDLRALPAPVTIV